MENFFYFYITIVDTYVNWITTSVFVHEDTILTLSRCARYLCMPLSSTCTSKNILLLALAVFALQAKKDLSRALYKYCMPYHNA